MNNEAKQDMERQAREALSCLYITVDKSIADDVKRKVLAWTDALKEANDNLFQVARKHSVENRKLREALRLANEVSPIGSRDNFRRRKK